MEEFRLTFNDKDLRPSDSSLNPMFYRQTNILTTHVGLGNISCPSFHEGKV